MAEVKWIKIATDIFDDEKILLIEGLPDAYAIITVWFKLLCLAGKKNNGGVFLMNDKIPYTDKMLATIFRMNESTVKLALNAFEQFKMIEIVEGIITIPNWNKHQTLDAYERKKERDRLYQEERRAKQRALIEKSSDKSSERTSDVAVSDIDKEEDKDIDKERDIRGNRVDYQQIADMYNATCVSFPRLTRLSEKRKRAIKARLRKYSIDDIQRVFEIAEESDFLKGENNRNWSATFDWMMNDTNMAKILDGNYKNKNIKPTKPPVSRNLNNFERRGYDMDSLEEQLLNSN
ncbi:phage replisome organizer N-terminal domain-containing protein [Mediterraneibacter gnavus]|jgi:predicted phage replisome organizer|uniref:phage replisome organizer N-terminal domain-containing protein n=1 Tax=Mediterraneibacter gnavus TaxID=33038 RepID=UPI0034B60286